MEQMPRMPRQTRKNEVSDVIMAEIKCFFIFMTSKLIRI